MDDRSGGVIVQEPTSGLFIECGADLEHHRIPFTRKHYYRAGEEEAFRMHYDNRGVYQTIMQYINPVFQRNEKGKWVLDASSCQKIGDFYMDFDYPLTEDHDFEHIREDVLTAIRYLQVILSIPSKVVRLYFSGNKGVHLIVPHLVLGIGSHDKLHKIYKSIAEDIARFCSHQTVDTKIYDDKRMFRMINSYNIKGKAYKIPITIDELKTHSLSMLRELAQHMRTVEVQPVVIQHKTKLALETYIAEWTKKQSPSFDADHAFRALTELPICIETMLHKSFRETIDERNNSCAALASFFMQQGQEMDETMSRMLAWGELQCHPPLRPHEIYNTVVSVYSGKYKYGCDSFKRLSGVCNKTQCPLFR